MNTRPSSLPPAGGRALVLGGGGSSGNAWVIGVIAGLLEGGLDVTRADLVVGTSAGATTAAQVTSADPRELFAATIAAAPPAGPRAAAPGRPPAPVADHLARLRAIIAASSDLADLRRRLAASALEMDAASDGSWSSQWRAAVATRLPSPHWPDRQLLITAVDALTGEPVVFDRNSGIDLVDAVAASCSSGPAYRIGVGRYIDGGYRSNAENADLASGHARVLVLSPLGGRSLHPAEWATHLEAQVDELRANGSRVETVVPNGDAEHLFGANATNPTLRAPAAHAGHAQGSALAERLAAFWQ